MQKLFIGKKIRRAAALALVFLVINTGCSSVPKGVTVVDGFELPRYLGKWYEIARLDHSFERGLDNVSAHYSMREDGGVKVVNRGYDLQKKQWREAIGRAYFLGEPTVGSLEVSFFGPFFGGYNVIALDKQQYSYVMVAGPTREFLWILAREKTLSESNLKELVAEAKRLGFETDKLIYVRQDMLSALEKSALATD